MMRMKFVIFPMILICMSAVSLAGYSDGYITTGEYEGFVDWSNYYIPLIVDGGGAVAIEMNDSGRLEVRSTSIPINGNWHTGGITDIWLDDYSSLLYLNGSTEEITVTEHSSAVLKGGRIDAITSMQHVTTPRIDLYCQADYEWIKTGDLVTRITGHWLDGTSFDIELINDDDYDETWTNINIIPEPAALLLFGIGGLLIRRRQSKSFTV